MSPVSSLFVLPVIAVAALTSMVLLRFFGPGDESGKYQSIDGMRGFLSLLVYTSHSANWYGITIQGVWGGDIPRFMANLGPVAVILFFQITGFLFLGKLDRADKAFNWPLLYLNRLFRLRNS
jgi:peptidoglycan/LPS O-acetylase OafA/YrhL